MSGGYGPPLLDFSPIGNLANTFFDAQDRTRKRKLEDLKLQADDEWAKAMAGSVDAGAAAPSAPSVPSAPSLANIPAEQPGKLPAFAAMEGASPSGDAASLLRKFEGYRDKPYWDVNAYRVGYGSDTITDPTTGQVRKVQPGERIDRASAEADLARRIPEFQQTVARQVPTFANLPENVQAGLTSVAYNYGSLPKSVAAAVETGDVNAIASAVEGLQGHNGGVNRDRRLKEAAVIRGNNADIPAPGAQNAQFQIPGQAPQPRQASAPASAPPQVEIPAFIRQGLQSPNPYVRQKAAEVAQKYIAQRQEAQVKAWEVREQEESRRRLAQEDRDFQRPYKERELGQGDERIGIDRERLNWERNKPMTVSPEHDVIAPDGSVIRAGRQKPNVGTEVINGRVVFIDRDARTASDITPQGLPSGHRPLTQQEKQAFGIPENTGAAMGPDGKPYTLAGTANTRVSVGGEASPLRTELSKDEGKIWGTHLKTGTVSAGLSQDFQVLDELMKVAPQGPITGRLAEMFPGVSSAGTAFQSIVKRVAPSLRIDGSGAVSDIEYEGMLQSMPRLSNRPDANAMIAETMKAKADVNIRRGQVVAAYQNGEIDEASARQQLSQLDKVSVLSPELKKLIGANPAPQYDRAALEAEARRRGLMK